MKPPHLIQATLLSQCLLLVNGHPVPHYSSAPIIRPRPVKVEVRRGGGLSLHCEVEANGEADQTLVYWLVNNQYPEDVPSHGRIMELDEATLENGTVLRRSLLIKRVKLDDFNSTFTCVVTNAAGSTRKVITLKWALKTKTRL